MTPLQGRVRAGLLLVVALFVFLEGSRYLATALWRQQFEVLPKLGVRPSGEVVRWASREVKDGPQQAHWESNLYDAEGRPTEWTSKAPSALQDCLAAAWIGQPQMEHSPLYRSGSYGPPWLPLSRWVVERNRGEAVPWSRSTLPIPFAFSNRFGLPIDGSTWSMENGRILRIGPRPNWVVKDGVPMRPERDPNLLGGFGPDGWKDGADGTKGERFDKPWVVGSYWDMPTKEVPVGTMTIVLADSGLRSVFFVRSKHQEAAEAGGKPGQRAQESITVSRTPLGGEGDIRPLQAYAAGQGTIAVAVGPEIVALSVDGGVLGRLRTDGGESPLATIGGAWPVAHWWPDGRPPVAVSTTPAPVRVIGAQVRFRVFPASGEPIVTDAVLEPVNAGEHAIAWLRRTVAVLRPPVLSVASFAATAPATYEEMFSAWLLDPLYAGRSEAGTLVLSVGVGIVCAALARRRARLHRPAARDVLLWTAAGALLGPVGLVWMRLVVPRTAVRPCGCGARRAVSVETCSACGTAWPAPARTGVEVFA